MRAAKTVRCLFKFLGCAEEDQENQKKKKKNSRQLFFLFPVSILRKMSQLKKKVDLKKYSIDLIRCLTGSCETQQPCYKVHRQNQRYTRLCNEVATSSSSSPFKQTLRSMVLPCYQICHSNQQHRTYKKQLLTPKCLQSQPTRAFNQSFQRFQKQCNFYDCSENHHLILYCQQIEIGVAVGLTSQQS